MYNNAPNDVTSQQNIGVRFGMRVRLLRKNAGWTQAEFSDHLGINRSFLSDIERGAKGITISYIETIAQGFKLSLSEIMREL